MLDLLQRDIRSARSLFALSHARPEPGATSPGFPSPLSPHYEGQNGIVLLALVPACWSPPPICCCQELPRPEAAPGKCGARLGPGTGTMQLHA